MIILIWVFILYFDVMHTNFLTKFLGQSLIVIFPIYQSSLQCVGMQIVLSYYNVAYFISCISFPPLLSLPALLSGLLWTLFGIISLLWHCCGVIKGILMNKKIIFENKNISNWSTLYFHCSVFSCISCIILVCCHAGKILSTDLTLGN